MKFGISLSFLLLELYTCKTSGRVSVFKTAGSLLEVEIRIFMAVNVSASSRLLQHVIDLLTPLERPEDQRYEY